MGNPFPWASCVLVVSLLGTGREKAHPVFPSSSGRGESLVRLGQKLREMPGRGEGERVCGNISEPA